MSNEEKMITAEENNNSPETMKLHHASEFYKRLEKWIQNFEKRLDQEHEVGIRLINFGQTVTFHLQGISYSNPSLIAFVGTSDQFEPVELIQHVSQISILLIKVKRHDTSQPKKPICFHSGEQTDS